MNSNSNGRRSPSCDVPERLRELERGFGRLSRVLHKPSIDAADNIMLWCHVLASTTCSGTAARSGFLQQALR